MPKPVLAAAALALLALAACKPQQSIAGGDPEAAVQERSIDWAAAERAPQVERPAGQLVQTESEAAASATAIASPVPVLVPPPSVAAAADGLEAAPTQIRPVSDGYFANYPGARYDLSVHGTKQFAAAPATAPAPAAQAEADAAGYRFEEGEGQAILSFSRFGADYVLEFHCKGDLSAACVTEAEAIAAAERLQVVGRP